MEAAFFDLDKTVIAKASMVAFGRPFYREGLISRALVIRSLWGQLVYMHLGASEEKLARMRESVLKLTKGWDQEKIRSIVAETLEAVVEPIIYSEAADLIEEHRAAGRLVVIISASPSEIVEPLGRYLDVDRVIASEALVDEAGRYSGEMAFYAYGPHKAEAMRTLAAEVGIDLDASYAYSDSATDIPMLEAVGHPVVVNPDRALARWADEKGWETRRFVRPVRLRDRFRVPTPPPRQTAVGAGLVGAVVGGVVWWRLRQREAHAVREPAASPAQSTRSFFAATVPRAMRMARSKSFFMPAR
ncbi:MAG TPA: HAD-IB family hydrolase [Acidimicrobiales bacterium]|nr:HAD-IB family hydrolase [Acidimicrobiales bacterium]